jgi:hypothetical protein
VSALRRKYTQTHTHTERERAASDVTGARSASEACAGPRELVAAAKDLKPSEPDVINSVRELAALCVRVCERVGAYISFSRLPFSTPCEFSANRLMLETDTQIESIKTLITTVFLDWFGSFLIGFCTQREGG